MGRRSALVGVFAAALALAGFANPIAASAHNGGDEGHTLEVALSFPDAGLVGDEQLCLGLYPGGTADFSAPPVQARCIDPGEDAALFENIGHGDWVVAVPGVGSRFEPARYQGQLVRTSIPDEPTLRDFGIDVDLGLVDDLAGTTGRVKVNVFGCPSGTDAGTDPEGWRNECRALAGGIPLSLSGLGTVGDTTLEGVTGADGGEAGRLDFSGLPAGAYRLGGRLPSNATSPAVFIQSSIEGGVRPIAQGDSLSVRPTEVVAVDVYLVLDDPGAASERTDDPVLLGFAEPVITGGLSAEEAAAMEAAQADDE
jgi:hypothetical protein